MNQLTIIKGKVKYEICIDRYKFIVGNNYASKFDILRTIIRYYNAGKPSEYAQDIGNEPKLLFNNKKISTKDTMMFHVSAEYSLNEEFKLGSKSLMNKYFETLFFDEQYRDTINTINLLFESLAMEISMDSLLGGEFTNMVPKQLVKLFNPRYVHDEYSKDEYDLSIEEIILIQLDMIEYIVSHNRLLQYVIICISIPQMTKIIYEKIKSLQNCYVLIFEQNTRKQLDDIVHYAFCERQYVDVANDEDLYMKICDNNKKLLSLKEGREYMEKFLNENGTQEHRFILEIMN